MARNGHRVCPQTATMIRVSWGGHDCVFAWCMKLLGECLSVCNWSRSVTIEGKDRGRPMHLVSAANWLIFHDYAILNLVQNWLTEFSAPIPQRRFTANRKSEDGMRISLLGLKATVTLHFLRWRKLFPRADLYISFDSFCAQINESHSILLVPSKIDLEQATAVQLFLSHSLFLWEFLTTTELILGMGWDQHFPKLRWI